MTLGENITNWQRSTRLSGTPPKYQFSALGVTQQLEKLHRFGLAYRDINIANVVSSTNKLTSESNLYLIDFGSVCPVDTLVPFTGNIFFASYRVLKLLINKTETFCYSKDDDNESWLKLLMFLHTQTRNDPSLSIPPMNLLLPIEAATIACKTWSKMLASVKAKYIPLDAFSNHPDALCIATQKRPFFSLEDGIEQDLTFIFGCNEEGTTQICSLVSPERLCADLPSLLSCNISSEADIISQQRFLYSLNNKLSFISRVYSSEDRKKRFLRLESVTESLNLLKSSLQSIEGPEVSIVEPMNRIQSLLRERPSTLTETLSEPKLRHLRTLNSWTKLLRINLNSKEEFEDTMDELQTMLEKTQEQHLISVSSYLRNHRNELFGHEDNPFFLAWATFYNQTIQDKKWHTFVVDQ